MGNLRVLLTIIFITLVVFWIGVYDANHYELFGMSQAIVN